MPSRVLLSTIAACAVTAGMLTSATSASAASSPAQTCGNGYREIDSHDLPGARIHLFYNGKTNCVVTWKTNYVGVPTPVSAMLMIKKPGNSRVPGGGRTDAGAYQYYAGPIYVDAPRMCITWGGSVGALPGTPRRDWYSTGHCG